MAKNSKSRARSPSVGCVKSTAPVVALSIWGDVNVWRVWHALVVAAVAAAASIATTAAFFCAFVRVHGRLYVRMRVYLRECTRVHAWVYACIRVCMRSFAFVRLYAHVFARVCTWRVYLSVSVPPDAGGGGGGEEIVSLFGSRSKASGEKGARGTACSGALALFRCGHFTDGERR